MKLVKARSPRRCDFCKGVIEKGESYWLKEVEPYIYEQEHCNCAEHENKLTVKYPIRGGSSDG